MTSAIINKILHGPTTILRGSQNDANGDSYVEAVRVLFGLEPIQTEEKMANLDDVAGEE